MKRYSKAFLAKHPSWGQDLKITKPASCSSASR
jgi:hypothetical protein